MKKKISAILLTGLLAAQSVFAGAAELPAADAEVQVQAVNQEMAAESYEPEPEQAAMLVSNGAQPDADAVQIDSAQPNTDAAQADVAQPNADVTQAEGAQSSADAAQADNSAQSGVDATQTDIAQPSADVTEASNTQSNADATQVDGVLPETGTVQPGVNATETSSEQLGADTMQTDSVQPGADAIQIDSAQSDVDTAQADNAQPGADATQADNAQSGIGTTETSSAQLDADTTDGGAIDSEQEITEAEPIDSEDAEPELILTAEPMDADDVFPEDMEALLAAAAETSEESVAVTADYFPDNNFRSYITSKIDTNKDNMLDAAERNAVTEINCANMRIQSLQGIEYFPSLQVLDCSSNYSYGTTKDTATGLDKIAWEKGITDLDLRGNPHLKKLICSSSLVKNLDISQNQELEELECFGNELTSLDVTGNPALVSLTCFMNKLETLNISQNPKLQRLECYNNQLTSLDMSGLGQLQYVDCSANCLNSLQVGNNPALTELYCQGQTLYKEGNTLASLDVSGASNLAVLYCQENGMTSLNVSGNSQLTDLYCFENKLQSLDVSRNAALKVLCCYDNQLTILNIAENAALETLNCNYNQLTALDLSGIIDRSSEDTGSQQAIYYSDQQASVYLTETDTGWEFDLARLAENVNIERVQIMSAPDGMTQSGSLFTFTKETVLPVQLVYTYDTMAPQGIVSEAGPLEVILQLLPCEGHTFEISSQTDATCTENGVIHRECTICGTKQDETIPAKGHDYQQITTAEPGCTTVGSECRKCMVCGEVEPDSVKEIPATGHAFTEEVTKETTCTDTGILRKTCTACGNVEEEIIPAKGHAFSEAEVVKVKEPTCTAAGSECRKCPVCGAVQPGSTKVIPAKGHSFGEYAVEKQATLFATGVSARKCFVCGQKETKTIPKIQGTIKLTATSLPMKKGQTFSAKTLVTGMKQGDSVASFTSSKPKVVKVDKTTGKLTALKAGKATITVTLKSKAYAKLNITVQSQKVATTKISGLPKTLSLTVGKNTTIKPVITPLTSQSGVTYKSTNKKVVQVSSKGVVKGVSAGTAKIRVQSGSKKFDIKVTVKRPAVTAIKNVPKKGKLKAGKSYTLKPKLYPAGSTGKLTYTSSNKKVATVNKNGKITAKKKGTATIMVSVGKIKVSCIVTVK